MSLAGRNSHLGADPDVGSKALHDAPEIALGFAVPVHRRGVEIADAELDRPRHRALLIARAAAYHQPANRPASEPEHRHIEPGPAERASFHRFLPLVGADQSLRGLGCQSRGPESDRFESSRVSSERRALALLAAIGVRPMRFALTWG